MINKARVKRIEKQLKVDKKESYREVVEKIKKEIGWNNKD